MERGRTLSSPARSGWRRAIRRSRRGSSQLRQAVGRLIILGALGWSGASRGQAEGDLDASYGSPFAPGRQINYFDAGGSLDDIVLGVAVDGAGRAVAVGWVDTGDATHPYAFGVARFTSQGAIDSTFGDAIPPAGNILLDLAGSTEFPSRSIAVEPSGTIVVAATRFFSGVATAVGYFVRLSADGSAIASSGSFNLPMTPFALPPNVRGFVRDGSGRFLAYGNDLIAGKPFIARLTSALLLDSGFGINGWVTIDPFEAPDTGEAAIRAMALDSQGRLVVAISGVVDGGDDLTAVARLLPSGQPDPSFGTDGVARVVPGFFCAGGHCGRLLRDVVVAPSGEILAVGTTTPFGGTSIGWLVKLSESGAPISDALAFSHDLADALELHAAAVDPRGGLLVAGYTVPPSGVEGAMHAARYETATLTVDPNFALGGRQEFDFIGMPGFTQPLAGAFALTLDGGRPLLAGTAVFGPAPGSNNDFAIARLSSRYIFLDDFETGSVGRWSSVAGAP